MPGQGSILHKVRTMPQSNTADSPLSSIITSILSAFESSRQIFQRIKRTAQPNQSSKSRLSRRQHPGQRTTSTVIQAQEEREEQALDLQLHRAPRQIAKTYAVNSGRLGAMYRRGDERAKASLYHTLLALNTGLTKIIATLLQGRNDNNGNATAARTEARMSLLNLSETSARDALMELEGLRVRLESMSSPQLHLYHDAFSSLGRHQVQQQRQRQQGNIHRQMIGKSSRVQQQQQQQQQPLKGTRVKPAQSKANGNKKKKNSNVDIGSSDLTSSNKRTVGKNAFITGTAISTPILPSKKSVTTKKPAKEKGGDHLVWIRSKTSSSTVIALSTRPTATYKRANSFGDDNESHAARNTPKQRHSAATTTAAAESAPRLVLSSARATSKSPPAPVQNLQGQQTLHIIPCQAMEPMQPMQPMRGNTEQRPEQAAQTDPNVTVPIKRSSMLSHSSSGSTKLGEIPQHKWINPWIPPVEVDEEMVEEESENADEDEERRTRIGLRFWRRLGRNNNV